MTCANYCKVKYPNLNVISYSKLEEQRRGTESVSFIWFIFSQKTNRTCTHIVKYVHEKNVHEKQAIQVEIVTRYI